MTVAHQTTLVRTLIGVLNYHYAKRFVVLQCVACGIQLSGAFPEAGTCEVSPCSAVHATRAFSSSAACFEKSFTTLKASVQLFGAHVQRFEVS
jgi:hypothetical protein